jgi:hypothetical protein
MPAFLKIEDYLAPPPLPALIALLMVLGLNFLGSRIVCLRHSKPIEPIEQAVGFILGAALVAAITHFLALAGWANLWVLRMIAWSCAALGVWELFRFNWKGLLQLYHRLKFIFQDQSFWGKAAITLLIITGVCLLLSALGPPTDADSLDYHLGVPLDILRHHGMLPRPDWLHARLTGLGESLNMLGLAGGTDILGAVLQFASLLAVLVAMNALAKTHLDSILLFACIIGCPVVGFLIPNQKPQMLPTAANTIALILIAQDFRSIKPKTLILALGLVFFAISVRYSFILTGSIIWGLAMVAAYRARLLGSAIAISLVFYLVLVFPVNWHNYLFYEDPISPFLERFKSVNDHMILRFASSLRNYSPNPLPFPLSLFFSNHISQFTQVLGLGPLFFVIGLMEFRQNLVTKILLTSAIIASAVILPFSQLTGRFFFEPYLWIIAATAGASWGLLKNFFFKCMIAQLCLIMILSAFGAVTLFPGALTVSLRDKVMMRSAHNYAETKWLDDVLPQNAVVLTEIRSMALMPRPFLSSDMFNYCDMTNPSEREKFVNLLRARQVDTLVISPDMAKKIGDYLGARLAGPLAGPKKFRKAVRNPWNEGDGLILAVYHLNQGSKVAKRISSEGLH